MVHARAELDCLKRFAARGTETGELTQADLGVGGVEVCLGELAGLGHPGGEALQAVQLGPGVLDLAGPVGLLVALEVAEVTGELHLNERRAAALPGPGDRL